MPPRIWSWHLLTLIATDPPEVWTVVAQYCALKAQDRPVFQIKAEKPRSETKFATFPRHGFALQSPERA